MTFPPTYDVAIVGSGFAGTLLARILRRQGRRVLLVEKGRHPRFALGESTTPLANFALERLAQRWSLEDLHHLATWGRWTARLPHLRRGLKRGFTFYRHRRGEPYRNSAANEARLLVAASPDDAVADTHWLRADVDHHLVRRAVDEGVELVEETAIDSAEIGDAGVVLGSGRRRYRAAFVVDATGPGGALARTLPIPSAQRPAGAEHALIYAHFAGAGNFVDLARHGGAVLDPGPYPDERAAVHHLLDEGWMYVLPFDHGTVSAGLVLRQPSKLGWQELLADYPTLAAQFANVRAITPVRKIDRLQHRLARATGERFALLPHAFTFVDPLFSTGIAWSLLAVERLAQIFDGTWGDLDAYGHLLELEADRITELVTAAWLAMDDFALFAALSELYFVTVSFAEARQRLAGEGDVPFAWEGFLGVGDPCLDPLFGEALLRLRDGRELVAWLRSALAPRNVAGLADPARRRLYPVDLDILVERAALLGLAPDAVRAALPRLRGGI